MANGDQYTVYVPDRSTPFKFNTSLTPQEVQHALETTGSLPSGTQMVVNGNTITFQRVQGGSKGI